MRRWNWALVRAVAALAFALVGAIVLVALFVAFVLLYGVGGIVHQDRALKAYRPVEATVIMTYVGTRTYTVRGGHERTAFTPVVGYRYEAQGHVFTSDKVFSTPFHTHENVPLACTGNREWASTVLAPYSAGKRIQAFYNPDNPSDAVLVKRYDFEPYLCVLLGAAMLVLIPTMTYVSVPWPAMAHKCRCALGTSVALAPGVFILGHYFSHQQRPRESLAYVVAVLFGILECFLFGLFLHYRSLRSSAQRRLLRLQGQSELTYSFDESDLVKHHSLLSITQGYSGVPQGIPRDEFSVLSWFAVCRVRDDTLLNVQKLMSLVCQEYQEGLLLVEKCDGTYFVFVRNGKVSEMLRLTQQFPSKPSAK